MRYLVLTIATAFTMSLFIGQALANQQTSGQSQTGVQEQQQPSTFGQVPAQPEAAQKKIMREEQQLQSGQSGVQGTQQNQQQVGQQGQQVGQNVAAQQLNSDQIKQIQQSLKDKGFDPGQVDGIMGPNTRQALQQFQQSQGIASSGKLNQQTLQSLDLNTQEFMGVSPQFGEKTTAAGKGSAAGSGKMGAGTAGKIRKQPIRTMI